MTASEWTIELDLIPRLEGGAHARTPLLLRGARQVGKTYTARDLGASFDELAEVNLEREPGLARLFEADLDPQRIVRDLRLVSRKAIEPGRSLLFLDEIQDAPQALRALRYFHEEMPELHVLAGGSLLNFALEAVGTPVGRVDSLTSTRFPSWKTSERVEVTYIARRR